MCVGVVSVLWYVLLGLLMCRVVVSVVRSVCCLVLVLVGVVGLV